MFEFHGWAVIRHSLAQDVDDEEQSRVMRELRILIAFSERTNGFHHLQNYNGMDSMTVSGLRNHRDDQIMATFRWLADNASGSYGLLYILDDEDPRDGYRHDNAFRVFRLARGRLEELDDPFLSPYIPTVEDPYEEEPSPALKGRATTE